MAAYEGNSAKACCPVAENSAERCVWDESSRYPLAYMIGKQTTCVTQLFLHLRGCATPPAVSHPAVRCLAAVELVPSTIDGVFQPSKVCTVAWQSREVKILPPILRSWCPVRPRNLGSSSTEVTKNRESIATCNTSI